MNKQTLIILRGYPGSGKTTIGKRLESSGAGTFVDHNAILTFIASIAGDDEGIYDEIATLERAICKKLLSEGRSVIVARGFSNLSSIRAYTDIADNLKIDTRIIRLDVSKQELIRRVQSPERHMDFNPTIDEAHAITWMNENPLVGHGDEIVVNNERPIDNIITEILSRI